MKQQILYFVPTYFEFILNRIKTQLKSRNVIAMPTLFVLPSFNIVSLVSTQYLIFIFLIKAICEK